MVSLGESAINQSLSPCLREQFRGRFGSETCACQMHHLLKVHVLHHQKLLKFRCSQKDQYGTNIEFLWHELIFGYRIEKYFKLAKSLSHLKAHGSFQDTAHKILWWGKSYPIRRGKKKTMIRRICTAKEV
jgi:hypothetical protein